jgi:sugar lactone lactonase YvrE
MKAEMINCFGEVQNLFRRAGSGVVLLTLLSACGGGSGDADTPAAPTVPVAEAPRYLVGGTVSGLVPGTQVVLANGAEKLAVTANGAFRFVGKLAPGASYEGKIESTSEGLGCIITNAAATMGNADVNTLAVRCLPVVLAGVQEKIQNVAGMVQDAAGNYYIADAVRQVIHKVTPAGALSVYAGISGKPGADDGAAAAATFHMSSGISILAIDRAANLYLFENCNALLRKITPTGMVSTVAGQRSAACDWSAPEAVAADGQGALAQFGWTTGMAMDSNGDVLLADAERQMIRRVTPGGLVSSETLVDSRGYRISPSQLAADASGTIYFSDGIGSRIYRWQQGVAVVVAGSNKRVSEDGKGAAASFRNIRGMTVDRDGNVLAADVTAIRRMTPDGDVTTLVGGTVTDATGVSAGWTYLNSLLLESSGAMIVHDASKHRLVRFDATKVLSAMPFMPGNMGVTEAVGGAARVGYVGSSGMCSDPAGNVYLLDMTNKVLRRVTPDGTFSVYAGIAGVAGSNDGPRVSATMLGPVAIACDKDGAVYFADKAAAGTAFNLRKIGKDGQVSTQEALPAGTGKPLQYRLAIDKDGYVAWLGWGPDGIFRRPPGGTFSAFLSFETVTRSLGDAGYGWEYMDPGSLVFDSKGNLYFDDNVHQVVFKVDRAGKASVFAGTLNKGNGGDGPPGAGGLPFTGAPSLAVDASDNLYLSGQGWVRKIDAAGVISTPALAWGRPDISILAFGNGTLYGFTTQAVVQTPLP